MANIKKKSEKENQQHVLFSLIILPQLQRIFLPLWFPVWAQNIEKYLSFHLPPLSSHSAATAALSSSEGHMAAATPPRRLRCLQYLVTI